MRAEQVVAVSAATRRDVINLLEIPPERIRQIYNAPDPRFVSRPQYDDASEQAAAATERRRRTLARYQINYPFVLYVGNIRPQKNVPRMVEAFAVLRGELMDHPHYKDVRLIIIGDEISRHPAVRLAAMQSRVDKVVRFLGFVPIETLKVFYEAASAFAFPSLYEGFGLPPLEAMAAGTPVVTSGVSSLPEVVGDAAVVVNPENVFDIARGLRDALLNEELRATLIRRGYEQVKRFSWQTTAAEVAQLYAGVVSRGTS
jgi:glycosyltransferase involved in cell wall biosynthesis